MVVCRYTCFNEGSVSLLTEPALPPSSYASTSRFNEGSVSLLTEPLPHCYVHLASARFNEGSVSLLTELKDEMMKLGHKEQLQ